MYHCSKLFTLKYAVTSAASCFGPLLSVIMFLGLGDQWRVSALSAISVQMEYAMRSLVGPCSVSMNSPVV